MSNLIEFNPAQVPAFARNNELSDTARALAGGVGGGKSISIKGGVFRLVAGGKEIAAIEDRYLDVVIVKAAPKNGRVFYEGAYDKDAPATGPSCWSNDGETPDASSKNRQSPNCATCPQNQAGSGQGNSRACRYQRRIAVVLANDVGGDVLRMVVPAASIFGKEEGDKRPLQAYARYLAVQSPPINPEQVVTRMRFDTSAESPKLFFQPMRWLTNDEYASVKEKAESPEAASAVVMTAMAEAPKSTAPALPGKPPAVQADEAEEAPAPKATKSKAKVVDVAEDEEPEVRKATAKTTAVPAKKSNLADVVADWDDE
jgi:hypothetical protein